MPSPHPSLLPRLSFTLDFLSLLPPSGAGGQGMGAVVSSSHVVSAAPSSSGGRLLTLFPCSSMGPSHRRQSFTNFSNVSPSHRLQLFTNCPSVGPFSRGAVLQEQAAPAWVPHGVTSPASKPALAWAPLSTGPQVLAGACSSAGSPWGHSLLQASTCSCMGSSPGCRWGSAPPWTFMGCRTACLIIVFSTGCRGISALSLEHLLPSFFTDLGVCRVVTPIFGCKNAMTPFFFNLS